MKSNKEIEGLTDEELLAYREQIMSGTLPIMSFSPPDKMLVEMRLLNMNIQLMTNELKHVVKGLV